MQVHPEMMATTDTSPRTPCSNRGATERVPLIGTKATADFHQGAQLPCCNPAAVFMATTEITPASPERPLPRGSHPYKVQARWVTRGLASRHSSLPRNSWSGAKPPRRSLPRLHVVIPAFHKRLQADRRDEPHRVAVALRHPGPDGATRRWPPAPRCTLAARQDVSSAASPTKFSCMEPSSPAPRREPAICPSPDRSASMS